MFFLLDIRSDNNYINSTGIKPKFKSCNQRPQSTDYVFDSNRKCSVWATTVLSSLFFVPDPLKRKKKNCLSLIHLYHFHMLMSYDHDQPKGTCVIPHFQGFSQEIGYWGGMFSLIVIDWASCLTEQKLRRFSFFQHYNMLLWLNSVKGTSNRIN